MKGQIQAQVFVYVMALVLIGMTLLYGYKAISGFRDRGEQVEIINFKNALENDVRSMATNYGSVHVKEYSISGTRVCFVDQSVKTKLEAADRTQLFRMNEGTTTEFPFSLCNIDRKSSAPDVLNDGLLNSFNPLVCSSWKDSSVANVFVDPDVGVQIDLGYITVDGNGDGFEDDLSVRLPGVDRRGNRVNGCKKADTPSRDRTVAAQYQSCFHMCLPIVNGKLSVRMQGQGDRTFLLRP